MNRIAFAEFDEPAERFQELKTRLHRRAGKRVEDNVDTPYLFDNRIDKPLVEGEPVNAILQLTKQDGSPIYASDLVVAHTERIHLLMIDSSLSEPSGKMLDKGGGSVVGMEVIQSPGVSPWKGGIPATIS